MNKNAYEIRLEVLSLAHADSWNACNEKMNVLRENDNRAIDHYWRKMEVDPTSTSMPEFSFNNKAIDECMPTTADIKARAEELYRFVEG